MKRIYAFTFLLFSFFSTLLAENITVYFVNTKGWSPVKAYVWPTDGRGLVSWPGEDMKLEDFDIYGNKVYSYTFDYSKATNIIFNGFNGDYQTEDLTVNKEEIYYCEGVWYKNQASIPMTNNMPIYGIYYRLDHTSKSAVVDSCNHEYSSNINIPTSITFNSETYSITSIGDSAFYGCSGLTSVSIPNSVTSIGRSAFSGCSSLTSITIPNSVTSIGGSAFYGCNELTEVTIPNSVTSIGSGAFSGCSGLTEVTIPNSVTYIGYEAFKGCSGLTEVTIPNSVTYIDNYAFYNCSGLTSVTIPNSVTSIGWSAFSGCRGLTSFTIPNSVTSIDEQAFSGCSSLTSVTIPNSVTSIGSRTFYGCWKLTSITIPNSVTSIDEQAFSGCSSLTSVTIPNSVTYIDYNAFYNTGIYNNESNWGNGVLYIDNCLIEANSDVVKGSYTIKEGTRIIGNYAFSGCSGLTSVTIPNSVTSIGEYAFSGCSGLTSVTIPNSVTSIGYEAFKGCSKLTSVTIPNSVTSIVESAFSGCSSLTSVTIPNSVTSIDKSAFSGCSSLTSVTIPNSVTSIGYEAFKGCSGLTEVTIPNSVTYIDDNAFEDCSRLTSVIWNAKNYKYVNSPFYKIRSNITSFTFGNNVEHIPADLCYGMSKLTKMTIPNSVTSIGRYAFYGCSGLTSVTIPNSVTSIDYYAFSSCSGLTSVIWNAKNCEDFTSYSSSPFYNIRSNITSFTFGNEVEHIPAYLCYGMSKLTEMTIPKNVVSIGASALYCSGLTKINYLGTVDKWVEFDFNFSNDNPTYYAKDLYINNELLTDVKITTADSIKNYAFYNCQSIKSVEIGNSVTSIGDEAFYNCSGLTKVNYLGTVDKWVEFDFDDYASNPTYYAKDLYINNELLTDVKITSADSIKNYAFYNCQSIKSVEIGESVTSIGSYAFSGCDKLRKVTAYPTTVPNVYENSFAHYNAALYVPCDVYDDYFFDDVFGTFKVTECIAAEEVDAPDKVEIEVDEDNNAIVIWPSTDGAKKYELEISKDSEVFCTLLFNENGQLTSIDFGNRSASVGFQFTVTGLDGASKYAYSMVAMDKKGNELQSYKGTFTTNGYVPGPGEEDEPVSITETLADANITVSGGTISADADFSIYNTIGQDVTAFNGSLQPSVYLVSIENNIVKVMIK